MTMTAPHDGSEFLYHEACESCGSSDACGVFDDGHKFCFSCSVYIAGDEGDNQSRISKPAIGLISARASTGLRSRRITDDTTKHFGYFKAKYKGEVCQVAPYYDESGRLVAQKLRFAGKDFKWIGEKKPKDVLPFGSRSWPHGGKKIVVTEGEIDAMAMSQAQGNKWPTVSIPTGANEKTVRRYFATHLEYFEGFAEVVLMFDMDEAGWEATVAAAEVLGSRAKVAKLPLKDPSEMLKQGRGEELIHAMWGARRYRPEGIVDLASLRDESLQAPEWGLSWPFEFLTEMTYGIRLGELHALGAGTGVGKSDFLTQVITHLVDEHKEKVGVFALEQEPKETATRIVGKFAKRPFHVPDAGWEMDEFETAWDEVAQEGRIFLYDSFGINDWESIRSKIRYLRDAEGVRYFFLDHLTALAAWQEDERKALEVIMAELGSLVKEIPIWILFVSHLATPEGKPHEEGGRVTIRHFKGSRAIGFWTHFMFGMERDQQAENHAVRTTTVLRCLKDRYTGTSTGKVGYLGYDPATGLQFVTTAPDQDAESYGFEPDEDFSGETSNDF